MPPLCQQVGVAYVVVVAVSPRLGDAARFGADSQCWEESTATFPTYRSGRPPMPGIEVGCGRHDVSLVDEVVHVEFNIGQGGEPG